MGQINVNIVTGGLGRQTANQDTWAGLFVEVSALPTNWTANQVRRIFRPEDVASFGITADASNDSYKLAYWHISEFFRLAPNGTLYVQLATNTGNNDEPATIVAAFKNAESRLRLIGCVFFNTTISTANVTAMQTALNTEATNNQFRARAVVSYKKDSGDTIPNFSAANNPRVMVDIANDITANGLAAQVFAASTIGMCGAAGTILGQLVRLRVHQKISWRSFQVNSGTRWQTLGDINGDSVESKTQTEINAYDTQGVVLVVRTPRLPNAYFSSARMAIATSSDYANMNNARVIDKAIGLVYDSLVQSLSGPVYVNPANGRISAETITRLQRDAYNAINNNMILGLSGNDVELSVDVATGALSQEAIFIDPNQDVLANSTVTVQIRLVPVGSADTIVINIGLVAQFNN